jgi:tetratricopeptide (TPR) repeat protein
MHALVAMPLLLGFSVWPLPRGCHGPSPRMMASDDSDLLSKLKELDREVAASSALKRDRTEAERQLSGGAPPAKVNVFGARLDDDVAGQELVLNEEAVEDYEQEFNLGVKLMGRGEYKAAVKAFTQATINAPGGMSGRKGGQYAIYLAQALQAANRKQEAIGLLKRCEAHPDGDVRKIADSVLYIMNAPELKLDADQFMQIAPLNLDDDWGAGRQPTQQKDPPPEKYSLEWYMLEYEKRQNVRREEEQPVLPALLACGALLGATGALIAFK